MQKVQRSNGLDLILHDGTNTDVSEAEFKKCLKWLNNTVVIP